MTTEGTTRDWTTILRELFLSGVSGIYTASPAVVEEFFSDTNTIRARLVIPRAYKDDDGERQTEDIPPVNDIPVVFPGSGGVRVKFPINAGDPVLLIHTHSALDNWLSTGQAGVDPGDDRHHSVNDAVAIPGLQPFSAGDASPQIEFTSDGEIHAGGSDGLVRESAYDNHRHADPVSGLTGFPDNAGTAGTSVLKGG